MKLIIKSVRAEGIEFGIKAMATMTIKELALMLNWEKETVVINVRPDGTGELVMEVEEAR